MSHDVCAHQYWDLGHCIDCYKTQNQIDAERSQPSPAGEGAQETPVDHRCPEIGSDILQGAFVLGAKWWEWQSTKGNYILDSLV